MILLLTIALIINTISNMISTSSLKDNIQILISRVDELECEVKKLKEKSEQEIV
jgi:hypothetical protein